MTKRIRLTSEQAREKILIAAEQCLVEHGVAGLKITTIAETAQIVHSSILHHFGSAEGLKQALGKRLTLQLLDEVKNSLSHADSEDTVYKMIGRMFDALGASGHANLLAWLVVQGPKTENLLARVQQTYGDHYLEVAERVQKALEHIRQSPVTLLEAKFVIYHVLITTCGQSMFGEPLRSSLGIENHKDEFLRWFANGIARG